MLLLWLLATRLLQIAAAFHCSSDSVSKELVKEFEIETNSMATKFRAINSLFIFDRPCNCEYDWKNTFCSHLRAYRRMNMLEAPTVCICRQFGGPKAGCSQFLTRCFPGDSDPYSSKKSTKSSLNKCQCCFNQPDDYCSQLECDKLRPMFGASTNTSCLCYSQPNYPDWICNSKRSTPKSRNGSSMVRLYNSLVNRDDHSMSWPYAENVAFVEETNQKRRIPTSREEHNALPDRHLQTQPKAGFVLNEILIELPLLFATCVILLGLTGFGCFLIVVTRMQPKAANDANGEITYNNGRPSSPKWRYENPESPKHSTVVLQNKLEKNAVRLTVASPQNQLLRTPPTVRFAATPETREIVELDYKKPCNCNKKPSVTLTV